MKMLSSLVQTKRKLFLGMLGAFSILTVGAGGYVLASTAGVTVVSKPAQTKTLTITVPYTSVLAAPSDGNGGYLVDLTSLPANSRITATDMYLNTTFTTNEPAGQQADAGAALNLVRASDNFLWDNVNDYDMGNGGSGYAGNSGSFIAPSESNLFAEQDAVLPAASELKLDVTNWDGSGSLSNLNSGKATYYITYTTY